MQNIYNTITIVALLANICAYTPETYCDESHYCNHIKLFFLLKADSDGV